MKPRFTDSVSRGDLCAGRVGHPSPHAGRARPPCARAAGLAALARVPCACACAPRTGGTARRPAAPARTSATTTSMRSADRRGRSRTASGTATRRPLGSTYHDDDGMTYGRWELGGRQLLSSKGAWKDSAAATADHERERNGGGSLVRVDFGLVGCGQANRFERTGRIRSGSWPQDGCAERRNAHGRQRTNGLDGAMVPDRAWQEVGIDAVADRRVRCSVSGTEVVRTYSGSQAMRLTEP